MKNFWNRTISLALAVIMAFGAAPAAFAIEFEETAQEPVLEEQEEEILAEEPEQNFEGVSLEYENEEFTVKLELSGVSSDVVSSVMPEGTIYYAACGDSITHANHALVTDIDVDDPYYPIDGYSGTTYARKNYAYYIAKNNGMQWANYGYGGTTLHHCYPKGYGGTSMGTFPFVDERITQLKEGIEWDYISLFFGYNDVVYGPIQQRDFWLTEMYGQELGYPINDSQVGTEGFANAEQKAACDAATGSVGGVEYTDNAEYFFAKFIGTVDDTETTTFLGAYNYALDYLTKKYPDAKIMIVNAYVSGTNNTRKIFRDGVNAIAEKWGVSCMDFSDLPYWFYGVDQKRVEFPNPHREDGRWYAENGKASYAGTIEGYNRARFTTDGTHPSNLGYQTISNPMERVLIDFDNTVNVLQGDPFETELVPDDIYTDMDVSVTMDGIDITDSCYSNGKIRIDSVTGNVIIRADGNITYTDGHTYENGICIICGEEREPVLNSAPASFSTASDAALYLRSQMIAREPSVTLRLYGDTASSEVSAILNKAWEHTGVPNEGDYIRHNQIGYDSSVVTGEDENGAYADITYNFNWLTTAEQEAEVDAAVDSVLAELDLWNKTDYEKIKGAYDWITENVQYDFNNEDNDEYQLCHSTYAAIILKDAVCQGYATLLYRFMLELGIDCRYVSGMAGYVEVERHAWNIVCLEGKYYNMDSTWDRDLMGHYRMFLCTESNFTEHNPDNEYLSAEWKAKYPMAVVPYVFNVTASGKLSNGMEWVLDGDTGTLTVAGTGVIPSYRYSRAPWYDYRESVQSIVISEGITEVGERAFYWCTNCTSLTLPQSLTAIREYGFNNLRALEYVTLPANLKTIEFCAFSECVALKEIVIPDSVTTCGSSAFSNCYGLAKAVIGKGLTSIPNSMFFGDRNLREVTLPEGVTYIGDTAFSDCGLFKFTIPKSLTGLGSSVFSGCRGLYKFTVESGNQYYKAVDGVLFTKDGKTLVAYTMGDITSYYYVPEGTEVIARSAFNDSYRLEHVYFPDSLKTIEPYAFAYCESLWSVTFTPNITRIGDSAFRSCVNLYSAMFKNPDVILESSVFANCDTMEDITLPANLKEIPNGLFYGSARLNEVTIPKTVTKIGSSTFLDCDSLKTITIPGNVKTIEQQAFDYCDKLETVIMEEGVLSIGWLAFSRSPKLKKVVIPSSVITIENKSSTDWTFIECPNVVLHVTCGTVGWNYARSKGLAHSDTHKYTVSRVVSPTCTAQGYTVYSCVCGASYRSNYTNALGHSYGTTVVPPTCTEQGYTTYKCIRCGYSYNGNYVPATGHSLDEWIEVKAPTCDTEGQDKDVCGTCGETFYRDTRISGNENKILVSNPLPKNYFAGKKIVTLGDSITCGVGLSDSANEYYGKLVADALGMTAVNKGVSGSGYCSGGVMATNKTLTETNVKNADIITIMLGINDWDWAVKDGYWQGKPGYYDEDQSYYQLGDFSSTDTSTFYGALHAWCQEIVKINNLEGFEDKQFVVITPLITSWNVSMGSKKDWNQSKLNVHGHTLRQYCVAILEVCAYYDIPIFDANMFSGIYYNGPEDNNVDVTGGDGVHINAAGHALLAKSLEEFLLEGYSYEERKVANCGHSYEAAVTEPTCTEQGYTTYRCPKCHYSYNGNYVPATGHSLGKWYLHKAPTTSEAGEERRDCANCDYYESREIPAYKVGDINRDGKVNTIDANYARRYAAGLLTLDAGQKLAGDVNLDGEVNVMDSAIIRRYVVKYITSLPYTG